MLATTPLSSPSHYAGARSVATEAATVSRSQVLLAVAAVVGIAAIAAPSIVIPVVVIGGILAAAGYGLLGLGEALEPLAEGRVAAASITYVPFNR
jgi:arginine exporter protein ArgO